MHNIKPWPGRQPAGGLGLINQSLVNQVVTTLFASSLRASITESNLLCWWDKFTCTAY